MKHITLRHREWIAIYDKIKQEYASQPSVFLIRDKMREVLGFTVREHHRNSPLDQEEMLADFNDYWSEIHIDFYSEEAKTYFMLRYYGQD